MFGNSNRVFHWVGLGVFAILTAVFLPQDEQQEPGAAPTDNALLRSLFEADQGDRKNGTMDMDTVKRDATRREQVMGELRGGRLRTASDHYHAAMVFQHGESADEIRLAFSLAWIAAQMEPENDERSMWLSAAAWDRILLREKMPQWYGTQYVSDGSSPEMKLYQVDESAVTDEERKRFHVPVLEEARKRVDLINQTFGKKPDR